MMFPAGHFGPARLHVLVADADPSSARRIAAALAAGLLNAEVEIAGSLVSAEMRLRGLRFSAVIASTGLGADAIERLRALVDGSLIMVGTDGIGAASDAMRRGADDFLMSPFAPQHLVDRLTACMAEKPVAAQAAAAAPARFEGFIGSSPCMREVYAQIERVAASRAPVFVTGESGTGKELAAQAVHARSGRTGAFVALNCGAIPRDLIESEIFGHMRGAFTGAVDDHVGAAEAAHCGTLFLDEICEMDIALQSKLLCFVQTGEIRRVGSTKARKVDVRIVCATNRDPKADVREGRFREDLFYRLHVLPVHLPPLRARGEDTLVLARAFLDRLSREEGRAFTAFDPLAQMLVASYAWPGNVRELESAIRRVVVLNQGGLVTADMLPGEIAATVLNQPHPTPRPAPQTAPQVLPMWVQEERIIEEALAVFGGNIARAAAALEINPSTIYRRRQTARKAAAE